MRCPTQPFSFDPYSDPGRQALSPLDRGEKQAQGRESTSLGTHREKMCSIPHLQFFPPDRAALSGILTPDQERHTYLIQSPSGLHLPTL